MKTSHSFPLHCLIRMLLWLVGAGLHAAPLTWFPGPSLGTPRSGGAATVASDGGNLLIAGDSSAVQELLAASLYWNYYLTFYGTQIAPGAVNSGGTIIVYGGTDGTSSLNTVIGYSPSDGASPLASMSVARSYLGYAPDANGNAYAIGGLNGNGAPLSSAERYNGDSNKWSAIASLPAARYNFPAVFDGSKYIYIFGGLTSATSGTESTAVLRYTISTNKWSTLASMPTPTAGSVAALGVDGKIYVVGGVSGGVTTNVVQVYNPATNSWTVSTPLPEGLSASSMGVDSLGRLIVMGGIDVNGNDVSDVWRSQQLNAPDSAPVFTQYPSTNATYLGAYTSSINSSGSPPPTYTLVSGPAGMVVDHFTGAITWTPQGLAQIGSNPVTIQAANYAGAINWSFNITVPNPPPTQVTNLAVTGVTESSVSLSWSPEDPTAGSVTYSVWLRHSVHSPKGSGSTVWYTQIGSSTTQTSITIGGLTAGLSQAYYVEATGPGGTSGYTSVVATTSTAPAPANFRVTGLTSTSVTLAWDAPTGGLPLSSYRLIGVYNGVFVQYPLDILNISGTTYTVTGLSASTSILWGVAALDSLGNVSSYTYLPSLVTNPVPVPPHLISAALSPSGGGMQLTVSEGGSIMQTVLIEATTNLADPNSWVQIGSVLPTTNPFTFTDPAAAQYPTRFYRFVAP